jgi:hypothetical protein
MAATANRRQNAGGCRSSHRELHVSHIGATSNQARFARHHSVPNGSRIGIFAVARA